MKRLLTVLLSIVLICAPALADTVSIDPDEAALEEIIALRDVLNARILAIVGELPLSQGVYTVGKDIQPGNYRLIVEDSVESVFIYVYDKDSANWYSFDHFYALGSFHGSCEIGCLALADGNRLDIQGAPVTLLPIP